MIDWVAANWQNAWVKVIVYYSAALVIHLLYVGARRMVDRRTARRRAEHVSRRSLTRLGILGGIIDIVALVAATIASVAIFVPAANLIWVVGLFSAAFGLGARPAISDILTGIGFLFEDRFAAGEKVEFLNLAGGSGVEGLVEHVGLNSTSLRSASGELYIVPNGEIRVIRNFSRSSFSLARVGIRVAVGELTTVIQLLQSLSSEAMVQLPNLVEPWKVISEESVIGEPITITLLAKAKFGKASELRPRMIAMIQERIDSLEIELHAPVS